MLRPKVLAHLALAVAAVLPTALAQAAERTQNTLLSSVTGIAPVFRKHNFGGRGPAAEISSGLPPIVLTVPEAEQEKGDVVIGKQVKNPARRPLRLPGVPVITGSTTPAENGPESTPPADITDVVDVPNIPAVPEEADANEALTVPDVPDVPDVPPPVMGARTVGASHDEKPALTPGEPFSPGLPQTTPPPLYLEVLINGVPKNLVAEFFPLAGGQFAARAKELSDIGIRPPEGASDDDLVNLADLGATVTYDEAEQTIDIRIAPEKLKTQVVDLSGRREAPQITPGGIGFVLNYNVFASARAENRFTRTTFDGVSSQLESWVYSPMGTLFTSGLVRTQGLKRPKAIRLDTYWTYTDLKHAIRYRVGDLISSGPSWARPVRMGGAQVSRSFSLRPDIVTAPLPELSGTAAVPTAIDVYVNNLKVHSGEVAPGPFSIQNIPALSQGGVARLIMRDAQGREVVREQRFYVSPRLLRKGLAEFSFSVGVPRNGYGTRSFDYIWKHPGIVASGRYGLSNSITLEGHAELSRHLALVGGGLNFSLFGRALMSVSGAVSHSSRGTGFLSNVALETRIGGIAINATSMRTYGPYTDLAALAAIRAHLKTGVSGITSLPDVPRAVESLNVGYTFSTGTTLAANLVHAKPRKGVATDNLNISLSQSLWGKASLYVTGLVDLDAPKKPAIFAGFSMPLGGNVTSSASANYDAQGRYRVSASVSKPLKMKDGAVGWRARVTYGDLKSAEAALAWRSPVATVRGTAMQVNKASLAQLSVDGALVVADGSVFATNRITDAFAVVNAGAPGVRVRYENREVGKTRGDGRLLVTSLRSLQRNKISIDPETMPVDAIVESDKSFVVPGERAGVVVNFRTKRLTRAALVILHDAEGKPLPPGAEVTLEGVEETFAVGYDGETFLDGLGETNRITVQTEDGACQATFAFTPRKGEVQPVIGPVVCR